MKKTNFTVLTFIGLIIISTQTSGQLLKKIEKAAKDADRTFKSVDNLNGTIKRTVKNSKPANSGNLMNSKSSANNSTEYNSGPLSLLVFNGGYSLTSQLFVEINGKYPDGYKPEWRLVGSPQKLNTNFESYVSNVGGKIKTEILACITDYQGKTVLNFNANNCNCVANFDLPIDKLTLSEKPVRLKLINFRKVQIRSMDDPNAPCQTMSTATQGGWKGFIDLSSDNQGNLTMNLLLENYASPRYRNGALMYKWFDNEIAIPNMLTPVKANEKLKSDIKIKIDAEIAERAESEKRANRERLDRLYERAVIDIAGMSAARPKTVATYKGYQLKDVIKLSDLISKKDREYNQFVIDKKSALPSSSSESKLAALQSASTKKNIAAKVLIIETDLVLKGVRNLSSWDPSKYEPHEIDGQFTLQYQMVNYMNKVLIDIAAYIHIGDWDKLNGVDIERILDNIGNSIDRNEYKKIVEYMQSRK